MADITILNPDCDDDDGKRGRRGKRGHRGKRGPTSGGLLKFSGVAAPAGEGGSPLASFLEDSSVGVSIGAIIAPSPAYPVAVAHDFRNMATNLFFGLVVPTGGLIVIELLRNGAAVPGFIITYGSGESGVKSVLAGPAAFAIRDTFDIRVTTSGTIAAPVDISATIGVE